MLLILLIAVFVTFQIPEVQTKLAQFAVSKASEVLDADINIGRLRISFFNALVLNDIEIVDKHPYTEDAYHKGWAPVDTLFKASTVSVSFSLNSLLKGDGVHMHKVNVKGGYLHIASEPDGQYKSNIQRMFKLKKKEEKNMGDLFSIDKVQITDFRFRLNSFLNKKVKVHESGANSSDLDLTANIRVKGLHMNGGKMSGTLIHMDAKEKGGMDIKDIHGSAVVGGKKVIVPEIFIKDAFSDISMKGFSMTFTTFPPFYDLVNTVIFESTFNPSQVDVRSITAVCGALYGNDLLFDIKSGYVKGKVNDLSVVGLDFTEKRSGLKASASANLKGTTKIRTSTLSAHVKNAVFSTDALTEFLNRWSKKKLNLGKLAHGQILTVDADVKGPLNSMTADCNILSGFGNAGVNLKFDNLLVREKSITMGGTLTTDGMDLGTVLGSDKFGPCTMRAVLDSRLRGPGGLSARIDTVRIDRIECLKHSFSDISGKLEYDGGFIIGRLDCDDELLKMKIGSNVRIGGEGKFGPGKLTLDVPFADLEKLNFWDTEGPAKLRTGISVAMTSGITENGEGAIYVRDFHLDDGSGWRDMGEITVASATNDGHQNIVLYSGIANAEFDGEGQVKDMISFLKNDILCRYLPSLKKEESPGTAPAADYDVKMNFSNTRTVFQLLCPDIYIADNTSVSLNIRKNGDIKANLFSPRLAKGLNNIRNAGLEVTGKGDSLNCSIVSSDIKLGSFNFKDGIGAISARRDTIGLNLRYSSLKDEGNNGVLNLNCALQRDTSGTMNLTFDPGGTGLTFGKYTWGIGDSRISVRGKDIRFEKFNYGYDESHYLSINGGISKTTRDTLKLDVRNLELGIISEFLGKDFDIGGELKGNATLYTPMDGNFGLEMVLGCDSLSMGSSEKSKLEATSRWNADGDRMDILLVDKLKDRTPLMLKGSYNPKDKALDAGISFERFDLKHCEPILRNLFKSMSGYIDGNLTADGPLNSLAIRSEGLKFDNAALRLSFNDVNYLIDGPVKMDERSLSLDGLKIKDDFGGMGYIKGELKHDRFKDINLKCGLYAENLKALDIKEKDSEGLYGSLAISGLAGIEGPLDRIAVNAELSTSGDGSIHIPMPSSLSASSSDLLTFVGEQNEEKDPYEEMVSTMKKTEKKAGRFTARANLKITPQVTANVEIDKESGHVLSASGAGDITLTVNPARDQFNIDGDYEIQKGSYHFEIPGIVSRDFSIVQGSSLNFGGALMNATMNINATHNVKTSLSTLIADSTASSRRNVLCGINIASHFKEPSINFSVDVPDLDPTTQAKVQSALNTPDKVQKQFMALLLLGTFIPNEQSGIVNGSNMIYSNVSEIMSSQVNNILNKLNIPIDLGFGYQQSNSGSDMFDVAVSTQLFNNRVEVSGTVGNKKYSSSSTGKSEVVGDLDIEIKIDKLGQLRAKLFSHSADEHSSFLDNAQRNGVGISFRKEYNNLFDLVRSIFTSRKRKEELERENILKPKETKVINVN